MLGAENALERGRDGARCSATPATTRCASSTTCARCSPGGSTGSSSPAAAPSPARRSTYRMPVVYAFTPSTGSGRHLGDHGRPRRRGAAVAASARPWAGRRIAHVTGPATHAARSVGPRRRARPRRRRAGRSSRCTGSGASGGAGTRSTCCCGPRPRRDLLRQRPDRPRGVRSAARAGAGGARRRRGDRVRRLERHGARLPAAADHGGPAARGAGTAYGAVAARADRWFRRRRGWSRCRRNWSRGSRRSGPEGFVVGTGRGPTEEAA